MQLLPFVCHKQCSDLCGSGGCAVFISRIPTKCAGTARFLRLCKHFKMTADSNTKKGLQTEIYYDFPHKLQIFVH